MRMNAGLPKNADKTKNEIRAWDYPNNLPFVPKRRCLLVHNNSVPLSVSFQWFSNLTVTNLPLCEETVGGINLPPIVSRWQAEQKEAWALATATMPTDCAPKRLWAIRPTLTIGTAVSLPWWRSSGMLRCLPPCGSITMHSLFFLEQHQENRDRENDLGFCFQRA